MPVVINTNYAATVAANNLAASSSSLQRSLNRLSSGSKIVSPSDDAGGLAVSMKLTAAANRQGAVATNIGNAVSYLQTQDGALKVVGKILDRVSELRTLADDPTKNSSDIANYNSEFTALKSELTSIAAEKFNGSALFNVALTVKVSEDGTQTVGIAARNLATDVTSVTGASALTGLAMSNVTASIQSVATERAQNGAEQSRLGFAAELITVNKANMEAAASRITDVDVAQESTQLARWNVLVSAGTSMLAQANQSAQTALRLLQ